jgi:hypothetical protein
VKRSNINIDENKPSAIMKNTVYVLVLTTGMLWGHHACPQGWVAEVSVDLNHNLYALEQIDNVDLVYSGYAASGQSSSSTIRFVLKGSGDPSGGISLSIRGTAFQPYDPSHPYSTSLSATFSGNYSTGCKIGYFTKQGATSDQQVSVWIKIYPRLEINSLLQECEQITLTTSTCYHDFLWEVGESLSGNFVKIPGEKGPSMSITREDLHALGFTAPSGRKYFRVTGYAGTTSKLQAVEIYYPGPGATLTSTSPRCHNGSDGSIQVIITSPEPTRIDDYVITLFKAPEYNAIAQEVLNNGSTITLSGLTAGDYRVRIQNNSAISDNGSCWSDHTPETLIDNDPVTIASFEPSAYNGYAVRCHGGTDGRLTLRPAGGTGTFTMFEWTPSVSTSEVAADLPEGTYKVRAQDSNGCWTNEAVRTLTAPEKLAVSLVSTGGRNGYDVSCHDSKDGAVETNISGGVSQYMTKWSTGSTGATLIEVGTGIYEAVVTDANGCVATRLLELTAPEPIDFAIEELSPVRCAGDYSGAMESQSIRNSIGMVNLLWSSGETTHAISNKGAGTYSLTVSDEQGCSTTRWHTLIEPATYTIDVITVSDYHGNAIRCYGEANGSLTALVRDDANSNTIPADNYTWRKNGLEMVSGATLSSIQDLTAGSYGVTVTYNTFCALEKNIEVNEPPPVDALISTASSYNGMPISCFGKSDGALKGKASGGTGTDYSYTWNTGATGPEITQVPAGTYTLSATDINGCLGSATKTLTGPEPMKAAITIQSDFNGLPLSCADASDARLQASATGGTPQYSYLWTSGQTTHSLLDVTAGQYALTVRDANGCSAEAETTVIDPAPIRATIVGMSGYNGYGVSCNGVSDGFLRADGTGGTGVFDFHWQESSNTLPLHKNLTPGNYRVKVTDQNGCEAFTDALITEPTPVALTAAETWDVSCNRGTDGAILLNAEGGTGIFKFGIGVNQWQSDPAFDDLEAGVYTLFAKDENGCSQSKDVTIHEPPVIDIRFENIQPSRCGDANGQAMAVATGGRGGYSFVWRDQDETILSNESLVTKLPPGIFVVNVSDERNCEMSQPVGITSIDGPEFVVNNITPPSCSYSDDGAASIEIVRGAGPFLFMWDEVQTGASVDNLKEGRHLVSVTDANNCIAVEPLFIHAPDSLQISLVKMTEPSCHGDCNGEIAVAASGGNGEYHFAWGNTTGAEAINLCAGDYTVQVFDEKGCIAAQTYQLTQPEPLSLELVSLKSPDCRDGCDGNLRVYASGGTSDLYFIWNTGDTSSFIDNVCAGNYTVTTTDALGCKTNKVFTLANPDALELDLGGSVTLCTGQTHLLDPGSRWEQYTWSSNTGFKSSDSRVTITQAGAYWLHALNSRGCVAQDTFFLNTSSDLLKANFLLATEAMAGDTVAMIDISWPLPEKIIWTVPPQMHRISDYGEFVSGKFEEAGNFSVSLEASLGACRDAMTKTIQIIDGQVPPEEGRLGHEDFVKTFSLFPNPNNGVFDVGIEFSEESPIILTVWNTLTATKVAHVNDRGKRSYLKHIDLGPLSAGPYTLRLDHAKGIRYLRFIVR